MTVGISGEFPFSFLMMENILVEIHYSLVKHWDGKCRILCVLVLMKFEAFLFFQIAMHVLAFSLRIAPFCFIYFEKIIYFENIKTITTTSMSLNAFVY